MMKGVFDFNMRDRAYNCNISTLRSDKTCLFEGNCRKSMVIYELHCKTTGKSYYGKTQQYLKTRTMQQVSDVWKIIETGRKKFGMSWHGSGGYVWDDSFSKHFAELCRECITQRGAGKDEVNYYFINSLARRPYPLHEICTCDAMQNLYGRKDQYYATTEGRQTKGHQR